MNVIDLLEELGVQPKRVASSNGGVFHSRCPDPSCDGKDRFCTWPNEGKEGRYWCRRCLRKGDAIQFCRDFMGMDFASACAKVGRGVTFTKNQNSVRFKEPFMPKSLVIPSQVWQQKAADFVLQSNKYLLNYPHLLNQEKNRGLSQKNIMDFQLGWNPTTVFEQRQLWGLQDMSAEGGASLLCLPQGIVIPTFREGYPVRIKIRRSNWQPEDKYPKYHIIAGGMVCPAIYGDITKPVVIVESELDAILTQQFANESCCCFALGGVAVKPDTVIDQILRRSQTILYSLDFDEAGKKAFRFWKNTYPKIFPWPVPKGKSPGDAFLLGVNLKEWIESGISRGTRKTIG